MDVRRSGRLPLLAFLLVLVVVPPAAARPVDLEAWTVVRSPSLTLMTDAGAERGTEIVDALERFRAVFAQLAPEIELESPAPTKLYAFRDARSYAPYKSRPDRRGLMILGQFISHPDGNYLTLNADPRYVGATAVLYHEYVHYFVRTNFPEVPLWFHEGLAEYYSTFAVEDGAARLGRPVARHLEWLEGRDEIDLAAVLQASTGQAVRHGADEAGALYAVSWLLVHHLLSSAPERLDQTADYLARVAGGEDPEDAFEEAFDLRLSSLEKTLLAYARGGTFAEAAIPLERLPPVTTTVEAMAPAEVFFHLGDLLVHQGLRDPADEHFQLALDHHADHPEAHAGLAYVRDLGRRFAEAEVLYGDALRLESRDPLTYLWYGRHLLATLDLEPAFAAELAVLGGEEPAARATRARRARKAFERAVELAPSHAEARALLGYAHLFDGDPKDGIRPLERAIASLPARLELVLHLVKLQLRAGDVEAAERSIAGALEGRDPELTAAAREEVERWTLIQAAERAWEAGTAEEALELFDRAVAVTSDPDLRARMAERLLELRAHHESSPP